MPGYTVYEYIRDHLGYRIELQSAMYPAVVMATPKISSAGAVESSAEVTFNVTIDLKNYGFSIPHNERPLSLVLLRPSSAIASPIVLQTIVADVDPRLWQPRVIGDPFSAVATHRFTATVQGTVPLPGAPPMHEYAPGQMITNVSVSEYDLGLYLPDMREPLQGKANYAIRVANKNVPWLVWGNDSRQPEGGVNVLGRVQVMAAYRAQA